MPQFSRVILRRSKEDAVKRFHPWIFSGAIQQTEAEDGEIVEVYSASGEFLATGLYHASNIAIKILAFHPVTDLDNLFADRIQQAFQVRSQLGLTKSETTDCYRLINAEGDNLPGLIVDWYSGTAVIQTYSIGMYQQRHRILAALQSVYGETLQAVYDKSAAVLPRSLGATPEYLLGEKSDGWVLEHGHRFQVDWETGQKTGFFLDQREHRQLLTHYSSGKQVLNTFSYSGGFSVYALQAGALLVHSVDSSTKAIDLTKQNVALNPAQTGTHEAFTDDVFDFLKTSDQQYDVIVLDPPAFAKNVSARHQAVMAYKRLNLQALNKLRSNGVLMTFSCSQVVQRDHFQGAVLAAAIESGRSVRVLHHLSQPADHPVNLFHPEGLYLKGLVLWVSDR
jgi:23S rRNA (cytosine1962-C5)-methyltransferase